MRILALIAAVPVGMASAQVCPLLFANPEFGTGFQSGEIVVADLNGDGLDDAAVTNFGDATVSILMNAGGSRLAEQVVYPTGVDPVGIDAGDINGDEMPDLVIANRGDSSVTILLNVFGNFVAQAPLAAGSGANDVKLVNIDGDADLDLVVANLFASTVGVYINQGSGTFLGPFLYPTAGPGFQVDTGDLDGDLDMDLAVACGGTVNFVSVLLNEGGGVFGAQMPFATSTDPRSLAVGDLDGVGFVDVAAGAFDGNRISVLLNANLGDGALLPAVSLFAGDEPASVTIGDVDGDSDNDIMSSYAQDDEIGLFLNNGDGSFEPDMLFPVGESPFGTTLGDLNDDGDPDLFVAAIDQVSMGVLLNISSAGDAVFDGGKAYNASFTPEVVVTGDTNNDGDLDLVVANISSDTVGVMANGGDGSFGFRSLYDAVNSPKDVQLADIDDDGHLDMVAANGNSSLVSIYFNTATGFGTFEPSINMGVGADNDSVTTADLDGDADENMFRDVIATIFGNKISILRNVGGRTFLPWGEFDTGVGPQGVISVDLNDDGKADVVTANDLGHSISVLIGTEPFEFATHVEYPAGTRPQGVVAADLDDDGDPDLAVANWTTQDVAVYLNNGDGTFPPASFYFVGGIGVGSRPIDAGDIDNDGDIDLVVAMQGSDSVAVLRNDCQGGFEPPERYGVGDNPRSATLGDFDDDGDLDVAVANTTDGDVTILLNGCPSCPGDIDRDGEVGASDFLLVLAHWGENGGPADVNCDGTVSTIDFLEVLGLWGVCP